MIKISKLKFLTYQNFSIARKMRGFYLCQCKRKKEFQSENFSIIGGHCLKCKILNILLKLNK